MTRSVVTLGLAVDRLDAVAAAKDLRRIHHAVLDLDPDKRELLKILSLRHLPRRRR